MKDMIFTGRAEILKYPLTTVTKKQLLTVYDKPMIYYPLNTLFQVYMTKYLILGKSLFLVNILILFIYKA
jgi:glucose-1-phosphate thymidylyltransferase